MNNFVQYQQIVQKQRKERKKRKLEAEFARAVLDSRIDHMRRTSAFMDEQMKRYKIPYENH